MTKTSYIAVCAVAAVGLSFASPKAASAFPAAPGVDKTYTQKVAGSASIPVRWGHFGGWGGRGFGFGHGFGWGGRGWGWRGVGWRGGWGWRRGWGWPVGLGLGLAATYPYYGGYYPGYYGGYYGGCGCGW